jgi:tetratricopeptide (TPR) repeat protein
MFVIMSATSAQPGSPPPLAGERLAFTGTLASMTHKEAQTRAVECGGTATEHVSRQTTMLVVGEEGWPLEPDGKPSVKLQQVERWRNEGLPIRVVKESDWLTFVGLDGHRREMQRLYTPAMLSQLLGLSVHEIRRWERRGLIRPVSRIHRLPYFDFQEVTGARRLAELLAAGVSVGEIQNSLAALRTVLGDVERPLAQLQILARDRHLVYRDAQGRLKTARGQRLFDFEGPADEAPASGDGPTATLPLPTPDRSRWKAADWCDHGRELTDAGNLAAAVEAYRMSLIDEHDAPEVHFHLAESLYRLDNLQGALERYHVAVELDPQYVEAWTQLGCLHAQLGEPDAAVVALKIALDVHPNCPDAHLHLAETLHQLGKTADAIPHWRTYLKFDTRGPWAEAARRRLEEAGDSRAEDRATDRAAEDRATEERRPE